MVIEFLIVIVSVSQFNWSTVISVTSKSCGLGEDCTYDHATHHHCLDQATFERSYNLENDANLLFGIILVYRKDLAEEV